MFSQKFPISYGKKVCMKRMGFWGFMQFLFGFWLVFLKWTCNMLKANSSVSLLMQSGICTSGSIFITAGCFTPLFLHCQLSFKQQRKCELITFYVHSYTWSPGHFLCNRTFDKLLWASEFDTLWSMKSFNFVHGCKMQILYKSVENPRTNKECTSLWHLWSIVCVNNVVWSPGESSFVTMPLCSQ